MVRQAGANWGGSVGLGGKVIAMTSGTMRQTGRNWLGPFKKPLLQTLRCIVASLGMSALMVTMFPAHAAFQIETDRPTTIQNNGVRLSAAPLTTGVSYQSSTRTLGQTFDLVDDVTNDTGTQLVLVQDSQTGASGLPEAPSLKLSRRPSVIDDVSAAASEGAANPVVLAAQDAPDVDSSAPQVNDVAAPQNNKTEAVEADESSDAQQQADFLPPYTDKLDAGKSKALFSPSQTVGWIIAVVFLLLFALLFSWLVRRLVTNALDNEEAGSEDLFQTANDQVYRFDDDDQHDNYHDNMGDDDEAELHIHGALSDAAHNDQMEHSDDEDYSDEDESNFEDDGEKRGFMSWLFSGNLRGRKDADLDETASIFEPTREVIDVDVEPVVDDQLESDNYQDDNYEQDDYEGDEPHTDEMTSDSVEEQDSDLDADTDQGPEPIMVTLDEQPAPRPLTTIRTPEPETPIVPKPAPTAIPRPLQTSTIQNAPIAPQNAYSVSAHDDTPDYSPVLEKLEARQRETAEAIADLRQKYTAQSQKINTELGNFRAQTSAYQQSTNQSLENRFTAMSENIDKEIAQTRKFTNDKLAQAPKMNTEDLEKKLQRLDEQFTSQSRATDMNFNKLMQKLDNFSTPAPQLSKLSNDTSELKTQISALQKIAAAPREPLPAPVRDDSVLRNLQSSLDENQKMFSQFQAESRLTARNVEQLGDRLARLETDLSEQRKVVSELIDHVQSVPSQPDNVPSPRMDPLGLMAMPEIPNTNSAPTHENVITVDLDSPAKTPNAYANGHDTRADQAAPEPDPVAQPEEPADIDITPILFEPVNLQPRAPSTQKAPSRAPQGPVGNEQGGQFSYSPQTSETAGEKTIRPLTFGFSNFDKTSTDR